MPDTTPTSPQNPVPSEPGFYFATLFGESRVIVDIVKVHGRLFPRLYNDCACNFSDLSDWSSRLIDTIAQPPAAPVAKGLDALAAISNQLARIPVESGRHEKFGRDKIERMLADLGAITELHFPALKAELEQLRGIVAEQERLDLDGCSIEKDLGVYGVWFAGELLHECASVEDASHWLRSDAGKSAVAAAKGESCR